MLICMLLSIHVYLPKNVTRGTDKNKTSLSKWSSSASRERRAPCPPVSCSQGRSAPGPGARHPPRSRRRQGHGRYRFDINSRSPAAPEPRVLPSTATGVHPHPAVCWLIIPLDILWNLVEIVDLVEHIVVSCGHRWFYKCTLSMGLLRYQLRGRHQFYTYYQHRYQ